MEIVNVPLLKHPLNWLTVLLMLLIAAFALHQLNAWLGPKAVA